MTKAYVLISADSAYAELVADRINELNGVVAVDEVLGPYDIVAEVEAGEVQEIVRILRQKITIIEGVRNATTCIGIK